LVLGQGFSTGVLDPPWGPRAEVFTKQLCLDIAKPKRNNINLFASVWGKGTTNHERLKHCPRSSFFFPT